jgi:hypothetical protein
MASSESTTRVSSSGGMPRASRSSGASRSGRTSDHVLSPTIARAASGWRSSEMRRRDSRSPRRSSAGAARGGSGGRTSRRPRGRPRARCGPGSREGSASGRGRGRCGAAFRRERMSECEQCEDECGPADDERVDAESETRVSRANPDDDDERRSSARRGTSAPEDVSPHAPTSARVADLRGAPAPRPRGRSSSRTCSSA